MQFEVERAGEASVLRVNVSKLTYPVLAAFFAQAHAAVEGGARRLVIDMTAVTYIDSATIGCLVEIHRLLGDQGGSVTLTGLHRRVENMITMTGVHKFLNVERPERPREPSFIGGVGVVVAA
jgi:anti-sigma B factor antagonist